MVLGIAAGATLCGMRGYKAIAAWAEDLKPKARERFGCRRETKQPPAKAGGLELRTESPDTRRLNDASYSGSILKLSFGFGSK